MALEAHPRYQEAGASLKKKRAEQNAGEVPIANPKAWAVVLGGAGVYTWCDLFLRTRSKTSWRC